MLGYRVLGCLLIGTRLSPQHAGSTLSPALHQAIPLSNIVLSSARLTGTYFCGTTHLLSIEHADWPNLHDRFRARDANVWQREIPGWSICLKFVIQEIFSWCCCSYRKRMRDMFKARDVNVSQREFPVGFLVEVSAFNSLFNSCFHDVVARIESRCVIKTKDVLLVC